MRWSKKIKMRKGIQHKHIKCRRLRQQQLKNPCCPSPLLWCRGMCHQSCCLLGRFPPFLHHHLLILKITTSTTTNSRATRDESTQTAPPQGQVEPSVLSQQSLPSTHRCPQPVPVPPAPLTQEYVRQEQSIPQHHQPMGCASIKFPPVSRNWSGMCSEHHYHHHHQVHQLLVMEVPGHSQDRLTESYPTSAGSGRTSSTNKCRGSEPSVYQHWNSATYTTANSAQNGATYQQEQVTSAKAQYKGGDPTTLTRVINEWIQKTSIALNTWSLEASQFWTQSVNTIGGSP